MLVMVQQSVSDANMEINGRYLFSGQRDLIQPYNISYETKAERGLTKTLDDKQSLFFNDVSKSTDLSQMLVMKGNDGNKYFLNTKTGNVYTEDFVEEGYKEKISAGQETVDIKDAVGSINFGNVSEHFDKYGVIKDEAGNGKNYSPTITVNGILVSLKFDTVEQYIVTYQGDNKNFSMVKENGNVQPASDSVNVSGVDIAGKSIFDNDDSGNEPSGANAFNDMLTVVAMCDRGEKEGSRWMNSDGKTLANNSYNTILNSQTKLAARQQVYGDCQDMLVTQNETILGDITDVHSTDVAKLAVELMTAQTIYQLSLSVGSRILPPTLADYL